MVDFGRAVARFAHDAVRWDGPSRLKVFRPSHNKRPEINPVLRVLKFAGKAGAGWFEHRLTLVYQEISAVEVLTSTVLANGHLPALFGQDTQRVNRNEGVGIENVVVTSKVLHF